MTVPWQEFCYVCKSGVSQRIFHRLQVQGETAANRNRPSAINMESNKTDFFSPPFSSQFIILIDRAYAIGLLTGLVSIKFFWNSEPFVEHFKQTQIWTVIKLHLHILNSLKGQTSSSSPWSVHSTTPIMQQWTLLFHFKFFPGEMNNLTQTQL